MKLSELQSLINKILESEGDMDVIRIRSLDIDGIVQNNFNKNIIRYSLDDFGALNFCTENGSIKYFTINTPLYDND